jgi:hypothetical protein
MKRSRWLALWAALGMMAATGVCLMEVHRHTRLGAAGVKVGAGLLLDEAGRVAARQIVLLPEAVLGIKGVNLPVTGAELDLLPKDTTFGRKMYQSKGDFEVMTSVVLMGNDRTSIHQPQYCLEAQDWHIVKTERVSLPMDRPYCYPLPALKLTTCRVGRNELKQPVQLEGIYVYWFVSAEHLTSERGARLWSQARTMLEKGVLERWAYVSYFTTCLPGQEGARYRELEQFIRASAPEFQTVAGRPSAGPKPVAAR